MAFLIITSVCTRDMTQRNTFTLNIRCKVLQHNIRTTVNLDCFLLDPHSDPSDLSLLFLGPNGSVLLCGVQSMHACNFSESILQIQLASQQHNNAMHNINFFSLYQNNYANGLPNNNNIRPSQQLLSSNDSKSDLLGKVHTFLL